MKLGKTNENPIFPVEGLGKVAWLNICHGQAAAFSPSSEQKKC